MWLLGVPRGEVEPEVQFCTNTHRQTQCECIWSPYTVHTINSYITPIQTGLLHTHTHKHKVCVQQWAQGSQWCGVTKHNDYLAHTASGSSPIIGFRWNQARLITRPGTVLLLTCVCLSICGSSYVMCGVYHRNHCPYLPMHEMIVWGS